MSALNTLKETAALAHSRITDVVKWDEEGKVTLKPSDQIPDHVAGAISEISRTFDKQGNPQLTVKMHGKIRPIDLLDQHYSLWEDEKKQAQKAQTNAFLDFLNFIKSDAFKEIAEQGPRPSLRNPPPGITITIDGEKAN